MKRAGYSRKEIATAVEVNVSFVSFAIKQNEKIIERSKSEPAVLELSVRALNVLKRLGVETPNPRTFGRITLQQLKASENCGVKSIREIEAWMAGKGHKLL